MMAIVMIKKMGIVVVMDLLYPRVNDIGDNNWQMTPLTNQSVQEGLVVGMVGKQRKYSMEQADIPNIR